MIAGGSEEVKSSLGSLIKDVKSNIGKEGERIDYLAQPARQRREA